MKIALIGATGFIGSAILEEALRRGHQVTAIVRHPEKLPQHPNLVAQRGDVTNEAETTALVVGHDAVISAYSPGRDVLDLYEQHISGYRRIIHGVKEAGVQRLLVVGGAGNDPDLALPWGVETPIVSPRDAANLLLKDIPADKLPKRSQCVDFHGSWSERSSR